MAPCYTLKINGHADTLIAACSVLTTYEKKGKENVMGPKLGNDSQLQQNLAKFSDLCSLGWGSLNA